MNFLSAFSWKPVNRLCVIIALAFYFLIINTEKTHSQAQETVEPPPEASINATIESTPETDVSQNASSGSDNGEGMTRGRSHFPKHPELFKPMPIPDPTNKPPKQSENNPEESETHTIENGKAPSSESVND